MDIESITEGNNMSTRNYGGKYRPQLGSTGGNPCIIKTNNNNMTRIRLLIFLRRCGAGLEAVQRKIAGGNIDIELLQEIKLMGKIYTQVAVGKKV